MTIETERIPMSQRELHRYHALRLVLERRLPAALQRQILALARGPYAGLNTTRLTEKLQSEHALPVSRVTVRQLRPAAVRVVGDSRPARLTVTFDTPVRPVHGAIAGERTGHHPKPRGKTGRRPGLGGLGAPRE